MAFQSAPLCLDPRIWNQNRQQGSSSENPDNPQPMAPPPPGAGSSIMPGSMADRARLAKLSPPDTPLKCPRCDSTNTKFCYFNNYSLSQPRHFCKTCRRYWTKGGALRNVPVGGGCRRNKRSKSRDAKSSVEPDRRQMAATYTGTIPSNNPTVAAILPPEFPFMLPLQHLKSLGAAETGFNLVGIPPSLAETSPSSGSQEIDFQMAGDSGSIAAILSPVAAFGDHSCRLPQVQQLPFLTGLGPSPGLYPFQMEAAESPYSGNNGGSRVRVKYPSSGTDQLVSVKLEEDQHPDSSRQFLGIGPGNDQFLGGGSSWTDLHCFSSSSSSNHLYS